MGAMKKTTTKKRDGGELEVAIAGDGVTPDSVPVRETVALLEAAIALVEAVAREQNTPVPELSLVAVRNHSAGYALKSGQTKGRQTLRRALEACRRRGEGSGPEVRRGIRRLYTAAKTGHVRLRSDLSGKPINIELAAPVEEETSYVEVADEIYGRIVGVQCVGEDYRVSIRYMDAGTGKFSATSEVAQTAASLFEKDVRASVTFLRGGLDQEGQIESVAAFEENDFLDVIREARQRLEEKGVTFGSDLLAELREDD